MLGQESVEQIARGVSCRWIEEDIVDVDAVGSSGRSVLRHSMGTASGGKNKFAVRDRKALLDAFKQSLDVRLTLEAADRVSASVCEGASTDRTGCDHQVECEGRVSLQRRRSKCVQAQEEQRSSRMRLEHESSKSEMLW